MPLCVSMSKDWRGETCVYVCVHNVCMYEVLLFFSVRGRVPLCVSMSKKTGEVRYVSMHACMYVYIYIYI